MDEKTKRLNRPIQTRCVLRERELRALELAARGWNQTQIGEELGIGRSAVSKMLYKTEQKLHQMLKDKGEAIRAKQTFFLEEIHRASMQAWASSKLDATSEKVTTDDKGQRTEKTRRDQCGDPRFLDQARGALADIRKIWGLDEQRDGQGGGTSVRIEVTFTDDFFGKTVIDVPAAKELAEHGPLLELTDQRSDDETASK